MLQTAASFCYSVDYIHADNVIQKSPKGQTAPGSKFTLVYDKKP